MSCKVLGLETSTVHGSVALWDGQSVVAQSSHDEPNRHAERVLGLVQEVLGEAGWQRGDLQRVAAGVGPGSFTGVRVGLAVAAGLAIGLGIPAIGVGSLAAIAAAHDPSDQRLRVVLRDARRQEFFVAAYHPDGSEVLSPRAIPQSQAHAWLEATVAEPFVLLGPAVGSFPSSLSELTSQPFAHTVARLAAGLDPALHPATPHYARGAGATRPQLPPSPLDLPRS